jgi:hypothetical protein
VKQEATNSQCTNIVALAGSGSINCSSLTARQRKIIEGIPSVLNKILTNQLDPDAVMAKLDEILRAVNPNAAKVTYLLNGSTRSISPGRFSVIYSPNPAFKIMWDLYGAKDWKGLIDVCEKAIADLPGWYTPMVFAGIGYINLGKTEKARELLTQADQGMAGNPDYGQLPAEAKRLLGLLGTTR